MVFVHKLCTSRAARPVATHRLDRSRMPSECLAHFWDMDAQVASGPGIEPTVTLPELAAQLGVTPQTLYDLRARGRGLRGFRVGTHLRFRVAEVNAWYRRLEAAADPERAAGLPGAARSAGSCRWGARRRRAECGGIGPPPAPGTSPTADTGAWTVCFVPSHAPLGRRRSRRLNSNVGLLEAWSTPAL